MQKEPTNILSSSHRQISKDGKRLQLSENRLSTVKVTEQIHDFYFQFRITESQENSNSSHCSEICKLVTFGPFPLSLSVFVY